MLLRVFLLFFLLLPVLVIAKDQEKAPDVLFDFATRHLDGSKIEEIIGSDGLDYIIERTQNWKAEDAHYLISSLTKKGLAPHHILKAIWTTVTFAFSTENHQGAETASDIFFDFATDQLTTSDLEKVIGDGWLDDVIEHTKGWKVKDARHLINSLTKAEIAPDDTLKVIRITTHFLQKSTTPNALETAVETGANREAPEEALKQEVHITEEKSVAEVFIEFAKKHRGENFEKVMGSKWVQRITKYTPYWTAQEVTKFLDYLVGLVGLDLTLARIKTASYLKRMHYSSFKEKVDFYSQEKYLGKEGVRRKLSQSFNGFHTGYLEDIKNTIQKIEGIIGEEGIRRIFNKPRVNLGAFAVVNTEITAIVSWLEDVKNGCGIPRSEINEAIIRNPMAFTGGKVKNLKTVVEEIKSRVKKYGLPEEITLSEIEIQAKLNEVIMRDLHAFTDGKVGNLKAIVKEIKFRLQSYGLPEGVILSEAEIERKLNETIIRNPQAFTRGKVENLKAIVEEIKFRLQSYGLPEGVTLSEAGIEAKLNEAIIKDPQAFTSGNVENLKAIVEEIISRLKNYGLPEEEALSEVEIKAKLSEAMIRDPQVFTISKVENLKAVVEEIKSRVKKYGLPEGVKLLEMEIEAKINRAIIRNLQAFTNGNIENLRVIVKEIKFRLKSYGLPEGVTLSEKEVEAKLNEAIIEKSHGFTRGNVENLKFILEEIKSRLKSYGLPEGVTLSGVEIEAKLNKAVMKSPGSFIKGNIENLRAIVKEIKNRLAEHGLSKRTKMSEIEIEAQLNEAITRKPKAFVSGNVEILKTVVKEIKSLLKSYGQSEEGKFSEQDIEAKLNTAIIRNPEVFTFLHVHGLMAIEKHFGVDGLIESLKNLSTEQLTEVVNTPVTDELENIVIQGQKNIKQDESGICPSSLQ